MIQISRGLDSGIIEIAEDREGGVWRSTLTPGDDCSMLSAEEAALAQEFWADDVGGMTRAERYAAQSAAQAEPEEPVDLVVYAALKRWQVEVGGFVWQDVPVRTDRESMARLLAERVAISVGERQDPDAWKFADRFRMVSNADFILMARAARAHVRRVFAIEAGVRAQISSGAITSTEQIDAAFAA